MRTVIQRVQHASVAIDGAVRSEIGKGLLILVGFEDSDTGKEIVRMAKKIVNMRIFDDDKGVMNRSVLEIGGEILIVSQFTLYASTKKEIVRRIFVPRNRILRFHCTSRFARK